MGWATSSCLSASTSCNQDTFIQTWYLKGISEMRGCSTWSHVFFLCIVSFLPPESLATACLSAKVVFQTGRTVTQFICWGESRLRHLWPKACHHKIWDRGFFFHVFGKNYFRSRLSKWPQISRAQTMCLKKLQFFCQQKEWSFLISSTRPNPTPSQPNHWYPRPPATTPYTLPTDNTLYQVCQSPFDVDWMLIFDMWNAGWREDCLRLLPPFTAIPTRHWNSSLCNPPHLLIPGLDCSTILPPLSPHLSSTLTRDSD